ncbi:transcription regulator protein BACH1-like [Stegastes partitus]|uniref:Transcription regulator protein BACH1-like n=1 Tax=Stegastes partitus TaxID=144197 RepID=A0A3B4ZL70_9TELE|nr:PREDICTED: transcription regulator protein BACH1-like [Stegastes partitus]XP_008276098.1 PREDICTED: transcription regulator protein BACH1-like [Stegastes partitus]
MSLMAMSAPRSSVFTFESTLHSFHVLRCLDEQRCRDVLCDVTVVVEGQSFRAHSSVLASCSEYFAQRISSSLTQHGAVIVLPQEVTVAGFEPLLKFAYTSKLHLGKDNALEIRNSASILGFRDLDEACFDFLLPKFLSKGPKKTCCKNKCEGQSSKEKCGTDTDDIFLDEKEVKPVADSPPPQEVVWDCNKSVKNKMGSQNSADILTPVADGTKEYFVQCPKYRKFQLACGKEAFVAEKSPAAPVKATRGDSVLSCSSIANSKNETETEFPENACKQSRGPADEPWKTEMHDRQTVHCVGRREVDMVKKDRNERQGKWDEMVRENGATKMEEEMKLTTGISSSDLSRALSLETSAVLGEMSAGLILHHRPRKALNESPAIASSLAHERFVMDFIEDKKARDHGVPAYIHQKAEEQIEAEGKGTCNFWHQGRKEGPIGSMERATPSVNTSRESEAVEHMNFQDSEEGGSADTGSGWAQSSSSEWLKLHSSTRANCPFLQDMDQRKSLPRLSECEGASQSGVSSLNSGEDGDSETETEGDSESSTRERARQMQLPYSVDWIVDLSRNDFQQLLKKQVFTREQLEFVHDMRRRSKNRLAAQRCRKRKLDCIYNLQCEINKLKTEREKLMVEKSQLSQLKLKTCHSVSALCQRVCNEANLQPEQLQVLTKYTSPDCPLSSLFSHIDTLLSQHGMPLQPQGLLSACSVGLDKYMTEEAPSSSGSNTVTGSHPL